MALPEEAPFGRRRSGRIGRMITALVAGVAGGLVAPLLYPAVARNARPAAKRAMKAGIAAFERGRVASAELSERTSDLFAEARAEYDDEHHAPERPSEVVTLRGSGGGREAAGS